MFNSNKLLMLALAGALTACGGGGKDIGSSSGNANTGTGNTNTGGSITNNTGSGEVSTSTDIKNPLLGTGVGSSFKEGALDIGVGTNTLSAGGSTKISVNIVDGDSKNAKIISQSFSVVFSSVCSESDPAKASFSKNDVATSGGEATVTYKAQGCEGVDYITVKLRGAEGGKDLKTIIGKINVAPAEVGALSFVSNESNQLSLSGIASSLPSSTSVTFKLTDKSNNPIADRLVSFALSNTNGGVSLALAEDRTDTEGLVKAVVLTGTTHNSVTVTATALMLNNTTKISTSSQPISITTGLPRQDRMSISMKPFNPAAFDIDGATVAVTVTAADAFGNPVPDGTKVNFMAESGVIDASCPTTKGVCSVNWVSGGTRPGNYAPGLGKANERVGFTSILAYTEGEAGFTDTNGNNILDSGESFLTFPEPFLDDNGNGAREPSELFVDTNADNSYSPAPSTYVGVQCSDAMKGLGHCSGMLHNRLSGRLVQSMVNSVKMRFYTCTPTACSPYAPPLVASGTILVILQDGNDNIPAAGTTLEVTGTGFDIYGDKGAVKENSLGELSGLNLTGLPSHGAHYWVSYEQKSPVDPNGKIELTAKSGTKELKYTF